MLKRRGVRWTLILMAWTLLGLFFATQNYVNAYLQSSYAAYTKRALTWRQAVLLSLSEWYLWAMLAPLVLWLARRFPIERPAWLRGLLIHALAGLVLSVFKVMADGFAIQLLGFHPALSMSSFKLHPNLLTYWAIVGGSHAFGYYQRYRERELRASQLEARLAQSQLQVLKMQLHPHFLFNTLHAISALMHRDVEAADRMTTLLSDLLRLTIESAGVQEVPLRQEMEFLERYLEIQQTRFSDRLRVDVEIDPATLDAWVPNLILQPLVENAIRHGIASRAAAGRVEIRSRHIGGMLELEVRDDGPGLPEGEEGGWKEGVGLSNTRARLAQLYGRAHRFELANAPGGGLQVTLAIPFRAETA